MNHWELKDMRNRMLEKFNDTVNLLMTANHKPCRHCGRSAPSCSLMQTPCCTKCAHQSA